MLKGLFLFDMVVVTDYEYNHILAKMRSLPGRDIFVSVMLAWQLVCESYIYNLMTIPLNLTPDKRGVSRY